MTFTFQNIQQAYTNNTGTTPTGWPVILARNPVSNVPNQDTNYKIGQFWIASLPNGTEELWYLSAQSTQVSATNPYGQLTSQWELISVNSALVSISDTANVPVFPSSNSSTPPDNIQLVGGTGISIVSTPASNLITITNTGTIASLTLTGNTGIATEAADNFNTVGGTTIYTTASGSTMSFDVSSAAYTILAGAPAGFGTPSIAITAGITNTVLLGHTGAAPSFGQVPNGALTNDSVTLNNGNNITVTGGTPLVLGGTASFNLTGTTQYAVQVGASTGALASLPLGTSGQVLTSNGAGANPTWQSNSGTTAIQTIDGDSGSMSGTIVTISGGSTGLTTTASVATMDLTGTLNVGHGGTGNTTFTPYSVITAGTTATGPFQNVVGVGTAGQILTSNGAGNLPTWQSAAASSVTSVTGNNGVTASPTTGAVIVSGVDATTTTVGVASFSSSNFSVTSGAVTSLPITVTGSGGITITGSPVNLGGTLTIANTNGAPTTNFTVDTTAGGGVNPVVPSSSGNIIISSGPTFNTGTNATGLRTDTTAANKIAIELQVAGAGTGATPITNNYGISQFNGTEFTVTSGFVSSNNITLVAGSGIALSPSTGLVNLGGSITISAVSTFNYVNVNHGSSPYTVLLTNQYISCDTSAGTVVLNFPNAPTIYQTFIVKDRLGTAATNAISITTPGGTDTFDGVTTYKIISNYGAIQLIYNGTNYEIY
jgi:hypothetical protein